CRPCSLTPLTNSCNKPSAVVVTLPRPILSSFLQNTAVGSSTSAAVGSLLSCNGVPIN
ncbi:Feather keratin Cos1-2, partial [Opisthocomus hoazin]